MNLVKQLRSFFAPTEDPFFKRFFMSGSVDFSSSVIALSRKKSKNQLTSGLSQVNTYFFRLSYRLNLPLVVVARQANFSKQGL
jgi:hypothetical protein